jgi:hypothetical protein
MTVPRHGTIAGACGLFGAMRRVVVVAARENHISAECPALLHMSAPCKLERTRRRIPRAALANLLPPSPTGCVSPRP